MVDTNTIFDNPLTRLAIGEGQLYHHGALSDHVPRVVSRVLWLQPRDCSADGRVIICDLILLGLYGGRDQDALRDVLFRWVSKLPFALATEPNLEDAQFTEELSNGQKGLVMDVHGPDMAARLLGEDWLRRYPVSYIREQLRRPQNTRERLQRPWRSDFRHNVISLAALGEGIEERTPTRSPIFPD